MPATAADPVSASPAVPSRVVGSRAWQGLAVLLVYRLLVGFSLLAVVYSGVGMRSLADGNPTLFIWTGHLYLLLAILSGFALRFRWFSAANQAQAMFLVDAIAIPLLMHAGIGVTSGMGSLLAVSIALTGLVLTGRLVLFLAAIATFGLFAETLYFHGLDDLNAGVLTHAGILGTAFFVIAALAARLTHQVDESESLAQRQAADLADLSRLNQLIIQEMATGVVAVDASGRVAFINDAARRLMRVPPKVVVQTLAQVFPALDECRARWIKGTEGAIPYAVSSDRQELRATFRNMGLGGNRAPLIFLEDASEVVRQAQQIKLASLGRLTAGIAHQIRNPLSSISHAGQLLAESPTIPESDRRLTEIIRNNSARVNLIIESILQLTRRTVSTKVPVVLKEWLNAFIGDYSRQAGAGTETAKDGGRRTESGTEAETAKDGGRRTESGTETETAKDGGRRAESGTEAETFLLTVAPAAEGCTVLADPMQLDQILFNLCENAHRHFGAPLEGLRIELRVGLNSYQEVTLDLLDNGPGFSEEAREKLFEPFFTSRSDGTGLGLYIAKELSDANHIELGLIPRPGGAHFRLRFPRGNG